MLICIETHRTCYFPGGSGPPIPPGSTLGLEHQLISEGRGIKLLLEWDFEQDHLQVAHVGS